MHVCKNGKSFYKGTEPSPKGNGYCAKFEKIGTKKRGKNKKMWVVRSVKVEATGKRYKRWFQVPPVKKKKAERPLKRSSTAKSTKSKRPAPKTQSKKLRTLRGGKPHRHKESITVNFYYHAGRDFPIQHFPIKVDKNEPILKTLKNLVREQGMNPNGIIRIFCVGRIIWSSEPETRDQKWKDLDEESLKEDLYFHVENPRSQPA